MILYLKLDPYLAQWWRNECGGSSPVKPLRGSIESQFLQTYLTAPPDGWDPTPPQGSVSVELPQFKYLDTRYNYYLSNSAQAALADIIRRRFDISMWVELHSFHKQFSRIDNLIYAFMEKHGIEPTETNWQAIAKRYQRKRDVYRKSRNRQQKN